MSVTLVDAVAVMLLAGLMAYAVTGGADFGGGVWDLLARGPRAGAQRKLVEQALAPIWEANHVWLIFVVVVLFTGFPRAYAAASIALHLPLLAMLLGIVLRGSAFTFRHYGHPGAAERWGRAFAVASTLTPVFLGILLGAVTEGWAVDARGVPVDGFVGAWLRPFPLAVGAFTLVLFAFLAAVYLACEAGADAELAGDFRRRAIAAGVALGVCALVAGVAAHGAAGLARFVTTLFHSQWTWPLQIVTGVIAVTGLGALLTRRYRAARALAVGQVVLILGGWALAQHPFIIAPQLTLADAAAPASTLRVALWVYAAGALVLAPSLVWLFRVFKASER